MVAGYCRSYGASVVEGVCNIYRAHDVVDNRASLMADEGGLRVWDPVKVEICKGGVENCAVVVGGGVAEADVSGVEVPQDDR